jgi:hypothetical protein
MNVSHILFKIGLCIFFTLRGYTRVVLRLSVFLAYRLECAAERTLGGRARAIKEVKKHTAIQPLAAEDNMTKCRFL